ncbi:hypothetical protein SAMN04487860_103212 [Ruminococcus flavefaciens]|uniref:Uncharacterized protein n=1 Tax=Ruminococcus flavefaciens TaxID=1265 RepID=A0A1M7I0H4_RUMFL|nr:hypothetical protein SAMN04487860_103212 [Ruminococcus flavefaciens]
MSTKHTPEKKTWMRIVVLALAGLMILAAIILPFI